ncbi:MAG: hypothetical protein R2827_00490 [Bdellovibrionales bacterium]
MVASSGVKFQLLAIDKGMPDSALSGTERFRYAELPSLNVGGLTEVVVDTFVESQIITNRVEFGGRFIDTVSPTVTGPTGKLAYVFQPANGSQPMKVHEGFITNGWFQALALDGINLSLYLEPGPLNGFAGRFLLENFNANQNFLTAQSGENWKMTMEFPAYNRSHGFSDDSEKEIGGKITMGFWFDPTNTAVQTAVTDGT